VQDSDGTLIIYGGELLGGTALTGAFARRAGKPVLAVDITAAPIDEAARLICDWIIQNGISVLNIAGPRASQNPGIYDRSRELLERVWAD
jgi:hypothetical protein